MAKKLINISILFMIINSISILTQAEIKDFYGAQLIKKTKKKKIYKQSDGTKIHIGYDGTTVYHYPNGKKRIISMDGKTPYGLKIQKRRRVLRRLYFIIEVIYSNNKSDNILTKKTKRFFDELVSQLNSWMYRQKLRKRRIAIEISNCRFCKTGFCKRKNRKNILITAYVNKKKYRSIILQHYKVNHKMRYVKEVQKVINKILP